MLTLGLTGGIGAGKSTVAELLRARGAVIIDTDEIARELTAPGSPVLGGIATEFGAQFILPDGSLDRAGLGQVVFADPAARQRLNALTHPQIMAEVAHRLAELRAGDSPPQVVAVVVPLLFEVGAQGEFDKVIAVVADEAKRISRIERRDRLREAEIRNRMAAQISPAEQQKRADWTIDNSGDREATEQQVERLWRALTA